MRTVYVLQGGSVIPDTNQGVQNQGKRSRQTLTRARILDAAMRLADAEGLDALGMRRLARELGCGAMSLYNHVADKNDLHDGMVEAAAAEIVLPGASADWRVELRGCVISAFRVMLAHPWLSDLWGRPPPGPAKNRYHDALLRVMRQAGFPEELACRGFHALTMHVVGYALQAKEMPFTTKEEFHAFGRAHLDDLQEQQLPWLEEHVRFHLEGRDTRSDFKYTLDLILDGLEKDLAEMGRERPTSAV